MQVFESAEKGQIDTLRTLLTTSSNPSDLILHTDSQGRTALHTALNRDIAELLIEFAKPNIKKLLWITSKISKHTALDSAIFANKTDIVEYLCGLTSADHELLTDGYLLPSRSPLHKAKSTGMAKTLIKYIPDDKLTTFLLHTDVYGWTALHGATKGGYNDLVEFYCSIAPPELILCKDIFNYTALHVAYTEVAVQVLLQSLAEPVRKEMILTLNKEGQTALHTLSECLYVEPEAVKYYISCSSDSNELLFIKDRSGKTALHYACSEEITLILIDSAQDRERYVCTKDNDGQTALHHALTVEIARSLVDAAEDEVTYVSIADNTGRTALHYARTEEIAMLLVDTVDDPIGYLNISDCEGNTAIMYMVVAGLTETFQGVIEYIHDNYDASVIKKFLSQTNSKKQNIFHLVSISPLVEDFFEILQDYIDVVDLSDVLSTDITNNTLMTYLVARFSARPLAELVLRTPFWKRREWLLTKNKQGTDPQSVLKLKKFVKEFYREKVLCITGDQHYYKLFSGNSRLSIRQRFHPEEHIRYDDVIWKIIKYGLNEYSLLDQHLPFAAEVSDLY